MQHTAWKTQYAVYLRHIAFHALIIFGFMSCAGKVDPILLESSLNDTQKAISQAERLGAKAHATETFIKATRLFEEAQQAQRNGDGIQSIELAFRAAMESQIAGAQARQRIAQNRIDEAGTESLKAVIQEMEYKTQAAQVRQLIAEEKTSRALTRALRGGAASDGCPGGISTSKEGCPKCPAPGRRYRLLLIEYNLYWRQPKRRGCSLTG